MNDKHIAFVPAREKSRGFPYKNRLFFERSAKFINSLEWIDKVIVSTDDPVVNEQARKRGYKVHKRPPNLAGPAVSIKNVVQKVVEDLNLDQSIVLWLFYLPVLYKNRLDFDDARRLIEKAGVNSLCTFIPARTHPYLCWRYDTVGREMSQYISNDVFRRQDLPAAWMHYHYVSCFKLSELPQLNDELLNKDTQPVFLPKETAEMLIEVDTPEDYEKWLAVSGEANEDWQAKH